MNKWKKVEGYKVETQSIIDDYDYYFVPKEDGAVTPCFYWMDETESDESCYDDIDELIENIEENSDICFEAFKKSFEDNNGKQN